MPGDRQVSADINRSPGTHEWIFYFLGSSTYKRIQLAKRESENSTQLPTSDPKSVQALPSLSIPVICESGTEQTDNKNSTERRPENGAEFHDKFHDNDTASSAFRVHASSYPTLLRCRDFAQAGAPKRFSERTFYADSFGGRILGTSPNARTTSMVAA